MIELRHPFGNQTSTYTAIDNTVEAVADRSIAVELNDTPGCNHERNSDSDARVSLSGSTYSCAFETEANCVFKRDGDPFDNPVGIDHISVRVDESTECTNRRSGRGSSSSRSPDRHRLGLRMARPLPGRQRTLRNIHSNRHQNGPQRHPMSQDGAGIGSGSLDQRQRFIGHPFRPFGPTRRQSVSVVGSLNETKRREVVKMNRNLRRSDVGVVP